MRSGKDFLGASNGQSVFLSRVRLVMANDNMTVTDLAKKLNCSRQYLSQIFGRDSVPLKTAIDIAKVLDSSLDWLCGLEDE